MKAQDKKFFIETIVKEVNAHISNRYRKTVTLTEVQEGTKILDAVWSIKRIKILKHVKSTSIRPDLMSTLGSRSRVYISTRLIAQS